MSCPTAIMQATENAPATLATFRGRTTGGYPVDAQHPTPPVLRIPLTREMARSDYFGKRSLIDRLWEKVNIGEPEDCWPFTGATAHGYGRIGLPGKESGIAPAHRVVALHYLPAPKPEQTQVRHLCGNRICCNPNHLAWGDQTANELDKIGHGRSNRGAQHGMAKISASEVREIRRRVQWGWTQRRIAETYGIAQQSVSEIVTGKTWSWLEDEEAAR